MINLASPFAIPVNISNDFSSILLSTFLIIFFMSFSVSWFNTKTLHLDRSGDITSNDGFSVVAPIKYSVPFST